MTKYFSMGVAMIRDWLPDALVLGPGTEPAPKPISVELKGTVGITPGKEDKIEASIAGHVDARDVAERLGEGSGAELDALRTTHVEAKTSSAGKIAKADPFVWLQLLDDAGSPLTHETFLGRGVGMKYQVRARIEVSAIAESATAKSSVHGGRACRRLAFGLQARLVTRTYRNPAGPRYHTEVLVLPLLPAGSDLPTTASPPALALVPALDHRSASV